MARAELPAASRIRFAADIGTRVYWLALLVGLVVGVLGGGFHCLVDLLRAMARRAGRRADSIRCSCTPALLG